MKFLKKSTYIRYIIAKLSKLAQISMLAATDSFIAEVQKIYFVKNLFCNVTSTGQISLPVYEKFPSYSVKCVLRFMLGNLMTS